MLLFAGVKLEPVFHQILLQGANLLLCAVTHRVELVLFGVDRCFLMHIVNHVGSSNFDFVLVKQAQKWKNCIRTVLLTNKQSLEKGGRITLCHEKQAKWELQQES